MSPALHIVTYHYVRDLPRSPFPRLKALSLDTFRSQVRALQGRFEMATMESALAFLRGAYEPSRDLCLLTFDDGLKEHYREVTPILHDYGIQGLFFPITDCLQEGRVAPVHMNHFLMAALDFGAYERAFLSRLEELESGNQYLTAIDRMVAEHAYPWDSPQAARFKYLFNYILPRDIRDRVVTALFEQHIGAEGAFARDLYFSWEEAKEMQGAGMLLGGHSHSHRPLARLSSQELQQDLRQCRHLLEHLRPQSRWPFCYPYGGQDTFDDSVMTELKRLGFACAFSTVAGTNSAGSHLFSLRRTDCVNMLPA